MAVHHITIAKASLVAACLKPDVTKINRDELNTFHALFEAAISDCTSFKVQKCKQWLFDNIIPSSTRTNALGKYLVSFSKYSTEEQTQESQKDYKHTTSLCRKRLHVLYVVNDLLHHVKHHVSDHKMRSHATEGFQSHVVELFQLAGSSKHRRVKRRVEDVIAIWTDAEYFGRSTLTKIHKAATEEQAETRQSSHPVQDGAVTRDPPYIMPATHGDPSTPYYDLPAANLMPYIVPNSSVPMHPSQIRALQLSAGPADESLINAVKDFLKDVESIKDPFATVDQEGMQADMDELGQWTYHNEADEIVGETYYGWSRDFCRKMKSRKDNGGRAARSQSRSLSRSTSRSHSRSQSRTRSPRKRRRYSNSSSRSRTRSRSRRRSHFREQSQSDSPAPFRPTFGRGELNVAPNMPDTNNPHLTTDPISASHASHQLTSIPSFVADGYPVPPPKPPNWNGPWPFPPPPLLPSGHPGMTFPQMPLPPPPPPPPYPPPF